MKIYSWHMYQVPIIIYIGNLYNMIYMIGIIMSYTYTYLTEIQNKIIENATLYYNIDF